jgi:hypothetical protein
MSKNSIIFLSFVFLMGVTNTGFASYGWEMDKFTGCVAETKNQREQCQRLCGESHARVGGYATQKNAKLCTDPAKPIACSCDVKKSAPSDEKEGS